MSHSTNQSAPDVSAGVAALQRAFPDLNLQPRPLIDRGPKLPPCDQHYVAAPPRRLIEVMTFLRDDPACRFEQLCDLTCVDYLNFPKATNRYGVNYSLLSLTHGHRLWVKCFVDDPAPSVPSVTPIWPGANWLEREVFDLFGVRFEGHPDLRRIVTWDGFEAHPLRKDYPLRGRGERESYNIIGRDAS